MKQITFLLLLSLGQTLLLAQQNPAGENSGLINDFEKDQSSFNADTFELWNYSTDGGQLITYYSPGKEYRVFDIWLFGETGKLHATYWTDNDLKIKIIKRTSFDYDRPYYEEGYKVIETTEYLSHEANFVKRYDADKRELNDGLTNKKANEAHMLFVEIMRDLSLGR